MSNDARMTPKKQGRPLKNSVDEVRRRWLTFKNQPEFSSLKSPQTAFAEAHAIHPRTLRRYLSGLEEPSKAKSRLSVSESQVKPLVKDQEDYILLPQKAEDINASVEEPSEIVTDKIEFIQMLKRVCDGHGQYGDLTLSVRKATLDFFSAVKVRLTPYEIYEITFDVMVDYLRDAVVQRQDRAHRIALQAEIAAREP